MAKRGTIIAFSGALRAGTGALSTVVSELLGWQRVRFSDFIRRVAEGRGEDPNDREVLQRLGQELVREHLEHFVDSVLAMAGWQPGENLVLDGLRHAEVHEQLCKRMDQTTDLHVVHIEMDDETREDRAKQADGLQNIDFERYDRDITEAQMEGVPEYAELTLDGTRPRGELAEHILRCFAVTRPVIAIRDDDEDVSRMEPLLISSTSPHRPDLADLAKQLISQSKEFANEIPIGLRRPLADVVRNMNCYYSNLIEGHDTSPLEIERALRSDYSSDPNIRNLQTEALAHIKVQKWIDQGGLVDLSAMSKQALRNIHDRFFSQLPDAMLWVEVVDTKRRLLVIPGDYREVIADVGQHDSPSPGSILRFLHRFEDVYSGVRGTEDELLASAAAHHRLLWIHPFSDGNGRVARLMSHAALREILQTHGLWSVARGLALSNNVYKNHLAACDSGRRNDFDGRGPLSEKSLADFTRFFLETCLEQVHFMRDRMRIDGLQARLEEWVDAAAAFGRFPRSATRLLTAVLHVGALGRREAGALLAGEAEPDQVINLLITEGVLSPQGKGNALTFAFPAKLNGTLLPGLFPP
jgi:Fic family protein